MQRRDAEAAAACLERFLGPLPAPRDTVLTNNGSEFTDRFGGARWGKRACGTGRHAFDGVCARHGVEHRLTRPQAMRRLKRSIMPLAIVLGPIADNGSLGLNMFAPRFQRHYYGQGATDPNPR